VGAGRPSLKARAVMLALGIVLIVAACSSSTKPSGTAASSGSQIDVVVAESFWGSIASQLGGDHVNVRSIISNPDTDPHDYEPTPQDGRALASANYVVFNGLGYDAWAGQAIEANPASGRKVLEIGSLLNLHEGDNPHRWYFPDDVERVINQITTDYKAIDPADAAYFDQQRQTFETTALKPYKDLLTEIKQKYAGTPVGASESIFVGLAESTGLNLLTPSAFLTAISEGTDPTAQDKAIADDQITGKQIKVFVFNSQNATPDVQTLVDAARANGIEVATVTETPPENVTFEDWQTDQLQQLASALARATGR
jgi:zinc/manganese transport system substrate-binding protein